VLADSGAEDAEKLAAGAALLAWKGQDLAPRMGLGEMGFSTLLAEKVMTFFLDCGGLVAAIEVKKSAVSGPLYALVDNVREKLKYCEVMHAQQGAEVPR
jgi:predicted regulator of Ras-like GTPase activity (Roadblock/LC7/MglB family)